MSIILNLASGWLDYVGIGMWIKKNKVLLVASVSLAILFLITGFWQLIYGPELHGYPIVFIQLLGLIEILAAICLFVRVLAKFSAICLAVISAGSIATHIINPPILDAWFSVFSLTICIVVYALNVKLDSSIPREK